MDVSEIVQPGIRIFGVLMMEPVTVITDLLITAVCFYAFWRVHKEAPKNAITLFMKGFFITMGIATVCGAFIGHGFLYYLGEKWKLIGWYTSMISVALIERAAISHARKLISPKLGKFFLVLNVIELITLMVLTTVTLHFKFVEYHSAYGFLVVVLSFHLYTYLKTKDEGSKYMLYNTVVLLIAVFIFNKPVILDVFFNHRDLAHLFMALAVYLIMLGTLKLNTYPDTASKEKAEAILNP